MRFLPLCTFMVWAGLLNLFALFTFQTFWVEKKIRLKTALENHLYSFFFSIQEYWYPTPELKVALMLIRQVDTAPGLHKKTGCVYNNSTYNFAMCVRPTVSASSSTLSIGGPALRRYSGDVL